MGTEKKRALLETPYAELIIRGADSRPIVISSHLPTGKVDISPGTVEDLFEAKQWLAMIEQVLHAAITVRQLSQASQKFNSED